MARTSRYSSGSKRRKEDGPARSVFVNNDSDDSDGDILGFDIPETATDGSGTGNKFGDAEEEEEREEQGAVGIQPNHPLNPQR